MQRAVRVLVVDDSALAREALRRGLSQVPGIDVVATAGDAYSARDRIVELAPDVMTLDIEMPRMRGLDFLKRLIPQYPIPVVMVSALTSPGARETLEALDYGAVDFVLKPSSSGAGLAEMITCLAEKIRTAAQVRVEAPGVPAAAGTFSRRRTSSPEPRRVDRTSGRFAVIAIGASTGGTVALSRMAGELPRDIPGVVVVQHMPPVFTRLFAERLDGISELEVKEARTGDRIRPGTMLVAPGDTHMVIESGPHGYAVRCTGGGKVNGHRPSVGVLFESVSRVAGARAAGILLTGMGRDGAAEMLGMRRAGARTLAQDEASSIVFGMPKEAWACGAAEKLVGIDDMASELIAVLEGRR